MFTLYHPSAFSSTDEGSAQWFSLTAPESISLAILAWAALAKVLHVAGLLPSLAACFIAAL